MAFCRFTIAGCAVAARELGYRTVARLVLDQSFSPARIVALFGSNASKSARRDLAFVLLTGSVARYRARPIGWSGEPEVTFARQLIGTNLAAVSKQAVRFVAERWRDIREPRLRRSGGAAQVSARCRGGGRGEV